MKKKSEILKMTSFSKTGCLGMMKLMKEKYNCEIVSEPTQNKETTMWEFQYQDPQLNT